MKGVPFTHPFTFFLFQIVPFHNKSTTFVNHVCNIQYTDCPHFQNAEKIHVAWGISHLLDNVPYKDGTNIKQQLIGHFGKTLYYRFYREERFLSPAEQNYIRQLFRRKGITEEPVFDSYTDEYNW